MFALDAVGKSFDGGEVLRGVSLEVRPGTTTALIGRSGCGKSTLLRLLLGLIAPDRGTVTVGGEDPNALRPRDLDRLRHRIGYVVQDGGLFPHLSARGNVTLLARHLRTPPAEVESRLATVCMLCRFDPALLDRRPGELSGGQRQRVGLMRALFTDPEALLMDEPLGALDPIVRDELQGELRDLFGRLGKTVVVVTHDLAEAARLSDDLVLLEAGRVAQRGPYEALRDRPAGEFVRRFVTAQRGLPA